MFFSDYNSHTVPYFVPSSILPLDLLYFKSIAILMHISNSLTPTSISDLLASQSNIHSHNTRSSSRGCYCARHLRLDKLSLLFQDMLKCVKCPNITLKSINVHDTLLQILSGDNDYIDLPTLITKIS